MIEKSTVLGLRSEVYLKVVGVFFPDVLVSLTKSVDLYNFIHVSMIQSHSYQLVVPLENHVITWKSSRPLDKFFCQLCLPLTLSLIFLYLYLAIDECINNPCHSGTCKNSPGSYKCTCPPEWEGEDCQSKSHNKFCMDTNAQPNAL